MARKHHKPEEVVSKLRQVDVLVGQGTARVDAIRQVSITEQTYYRWRKQYGGMHCPTGNCEANADRGTDQLKELKKVQKENEQLRRAVAMFSAVSQIIKSPAWTNSCLGVTLMKQRN